MPQAPRKSSDPDIITYWLKFPVTETTKKELALYSVARRNYHWIVATQTASYPRSQMFLPMGIPEPWTSLLHWRI